jgi:hypothetical protein
MGMFERSYPDSIITHSTPEREASSNIIIRSPGWSGNVIHTNDNDPDSRKFVFNVSGSMSNQYVTPGPSYSINGGGGYVNYNTNDVIIGISLEHFGKSHWNNYGYEGSNNQILGRSYSSSGVETVHPAFGGVIGAGALSYDDGNIFIEEFTTDDGSSQTTAQNVAFRNCNFPSYDAPFNSLLWPGWSAARANNSSGVLYTDLPIFATDADLIEFIDSNGTITRKMLNFSNPADDYKERFQYWYVKNVFGKNTQVATSYTGARNYRFFPRSEQKICFLKIQPTAGSPYTLQLQTQYNYNVKKANAFDSADGDYTDYTGNVDIYYLDESISLGNDYYTKFIFDTDIPIAGSQQDINDYFAGIKTIEEIALNWEQIARNNEYLLDPDWQGTNKDSSTPTGSNGMVFTYGSKLWEISNIELAALFNEIFDPDVVEAILQGNKLFGSEALSCVNSITYLPIQNASDVCSMGASGNIWLGSWESQNAQGVKITKNDKKINVGSFNMTPIYNDFRDFEPYTRLYVMLPYAGAHELTISKYMGKAVKVEAAIDITTGTILYLIYGNNILLDTFSGTCGAQRPITGRDSIQYISNIIGSITGASSTMTGATKAAGDVASGMTAASGAGLSAGAVAAGGALAGAAVVGVGYVAGSLKAYEIKNAVDNPPLISTGALAGCISYFANNKVHFIVAQKKTVVPANLQSQIGRPSNQGGSVGSFTGYLKCSAFQMGSFSGTNAELTEIYSAMAQGVYI